MLNNALLAADGCLNLFTAALKQKCIKGSAVLVKLRNNTYLDVVYLPANQQDGLDAEGFASNEGNHRWYASGKSLRNNDFDLIEFN